MAEIQIVTKKIIEKIYDKWQGKAPGLLPGGPGIWVGDPRRNADTPYFQAFLATFFALAYICIVREDLRATGKLQTSKTDVCPLSRVNTNTPRQRTQNDNFVISLKSMHFAYLCVRNRTVPPQNTNIFLKYLQPVYISFTFIYY